MDLIGALSGQLGLGQQEAKGLAGGLLGLVKAGLAEQQGPEAAAQLEAEVPEISAWQQEGDTPEGQPGVSELLGNLGGLGGALGGMLGGGSHQASLVGAVAQLVGRFGLDASKASMAAGLVVQFLEQKLGPELLAKARPVIGMLSGGSGGAASVLGGLLG